MPILKSVISKIPYSFLLFYVLKNTLNKIKTFIIIKAIKKINKNLIVASVHFFLVLFVLI